MNYYIYKIYEKSNEDIFYIGSTNNFNKRKFSHKKSCNNKSSKKYKLKLYKYIRECGGWDMFNMEIYETLENCIKKDCLSKEHNIVNELKPKLNTNFNISKQTI